MADFDETAGRQREAFAGKGLNVTFVQVDVVDPTSVSQMVERRSNFTGRLTY